MLNLKWSLLSCKDVKMLFLIQLSLMLMLMSKNLQFVFVVFLIQHQCFRVLVSFVNIH
jgi:hypothetical protein